MNESLKLFRTAFRVLIAGIIATLVWYAGLLLLFGPAQNILADPAYQSQKFLDVFTKLEPLPRMYGQPVSFYFGFLIVGTAFSLAWHLVSDGIIGKTVKRGVLFGSVAWLLLIPWFEFYLPWNVMHEPILLVLLEAGLWFVVMILVSIATVFTHNFLKTRNI